MFAAMSLPPCSATTMHMIISCPVALLLSCLPLVAQHQVTASSAEDAIASHTVTIPTRIPSGSDLYCVEATIEGKTAWMVVDSGADGLIADERLAEPAGIKLVKSGQASGADGKVLTTFTGRVKEFVAGPAVIRNQDLFFVNLSNLGPFMIDGEEKPRGGQLGAGFLSSSGAVLDYNKNRLLVPKVKINGGIAGLYQQEGYHVEKLLESGGKFYARAALDGKPVLFLCDTGANSMTLRLDFAKSIGARIETREGTITTLGKTFKDQQFTRIAKLTVGPTLIPDAPFFVVADQQPMPTLGDLPVVGLMGTNFFKPSMAILDFGSAAMVLCVAGKTKKTSK